MTWRSAASQRPNLLAGHDPLTGVVIASPPITIAFKAGHIVHRQREVDDQQEGIADHGRDRTAIGVWISCQRQRRGPGAWTIEKAKTAQLFAGLHGVCFGKAMSDALPPIR